MLTIEAVPTIATDARDLYGGLIDRARVLAELHRKAALIASGELPADEGLIVEIELAERAAK